MVPVRWRQPVDPELESELLQGVGGEAQDCCGLPGGKESAARHVISL